MPMLTVSPPLPQWDDGKGSHHPDYNPYAKGENVIKASRETEELLNAIVKVRSRGLSGRPRKSIPRDGHKTTGGAFFLVAGVPFFSLEAKVFIQNPEPSLDMNFHAASCR